MEKDKNSAMKEITSGAGIIFIGAIVSYIFSFLYMFFAARYTTVDDFGKLSIGMLVMGIGVVISNFGLSNGAKRFVSFYLAKRDSASVKGTILASYLISTICSLAVTAIILLSSDWISLHIFHSSGLAGTIRIFAMIIPFSTFILISNELYLAFKRPWLKVTIDAAMDKIVRVIILLIVILVGVSLFSLSMAYLIGIFIAWIVSLVFIYRLTKKYLSRSIKAKYGYKSLLIFSVPLLGSAAIGLVMQKFDKLVIGYFMQPAYVGIYNIAFSFAVFLTYWIGSFGALYYPIVTGYLQKNKVAMVSELYISVSRLIFALSLPLFLVLVLFPGQILSLFFKPEYGAGSAAMVILSFGMMASVAFGPTNQTLQVFSKTRQIFYIRLFVVILNVVLNIILIQFMGINGVAIATALSLVIQQILFINLIRKLMRLSFRVLAYIKFIFSGIIAMGMIYLVKMFIPINNIFVLFLLGSLVFIAYIALLILFRSFTDEDRMLLRSIEERFGIRNSIIEKVIR